MSRKSSFVSDLMVVLRGRDFRKLFAVRLASQASDGAFQVGLASLVFFSPDRATTPQAVALAAVVTILPYTVIGPFAGVLLDVWPRRQVLFFANAIRAVMVVGVAGLIFGGLVGVPLYLTALACLSVNRFFLAGLGAALPSVVPRHELVMANAVSPTCGTVAALLGAGVGYGIRVGLGSGDPTDGLVLLVAALGYAASALLALRMHKHLLGPDHRAPLDRHSFTKAAGDVLRDLRDGAHHVRQRPRAFRALSTIGAHRIGYGVMTISVALLCRNHFTDPADVDAGVSLLGRAVGATGLGIAAAAFLTPVAATRLGPWRWISICVGAAAVMQLVLAIHLDVTLMFVGAFVIGLTGQGAKICVDAIVQRTVDDAFRGRVFSFYDVVFNAAFVAAAGLSVLVLPADGFSAAVYATIAVLYASTAIVYTVKEMRDSALDLEHEPRLPTQVDPRSRDDDRGDTRLDRDRRLPR